MTDIFFLTPPVSREERYGRLAGAGSSAPSLGILMLAAVARRSGFTCRLLDATAQDLTFEQTLEAVAAAKPAVLALSATTLGIGEAARLAEAAKVILYPLLVIAGGPHVSAVPEETLRQFLAFDVAVVGEGEETLLEALAAHASGRLGEVRGIVFRNGDEIVATPRRPYIGNLDDLPFPAWDLLDGFPERYPLPVFKTRRAPSASLVTSRGCPNRCVFCDRSVFGASCHAFSAEYVIEMLKELRTRYGVREISFEDDTFTTFRPRLSAICEEIIRLKLDVSWSCLGRANNVDPELLALMKRAGCWQISFGVESGSDRILKLIKKNVTREQIAAAVAAARKAGLATKGFFIVGHPGETKETLRETVDFALDLPLDDISVMMLTPFPGSEIYNRAEEFGVFCREWKRMNLLDPVFVPHGLVKADLEMTQRELVRRFYLRPRVIGSYLRRAAGNPRVIASLFRSARSVLRTM